MKRRDYTYILSKSGIVDENVGHSIPKSGHNFPVVAENKVVFTGRESTAG